MSIDKIKQEIKKKYAEIIINAFNNNTSSCCGNSSCYSTGYTNFSVDYTKLNGYNPEADFGLGCGLPTELAMVKEGDTVIDLGSGAGNDVFIVRSLTGANGKVIGIDFTKEMIELARENNKKLGYKNVEFRYGEIEKIPVTANKADVVISNCVLNLVPDKNRAFQEIYRILKPGGHFSISDIVTNKKLPEFIKSVVEFYTGCIAGAITQNEYIKIIQNSGFINIQAQKEREINIPDNFIKDKVNRKEFELYKKSGLKILSINIYGEKPNIKCC